MNFDATGLVVLLAVPLLAFFYWRPRRLPVRRVAGLFLWVDPRHAGSDQSRRATGRARLAARDLVLVAILTLLACGIFGSGNEQPGRIRSELATTGRVILCVACMALLLANWRAGKDQ